MKLWQTSSWYSGEPKRLSKHEITFLLNPQMGTEATEDSNTPTTLGIAEWNPSDYEVTMPSTPLSGMVGYLEEVEETSAIHEAMARTMSAFKMAYSGAESSMVPVSDEVMSFGVNDESRDHEIGYIKETSEVGTNHISLTNGELITDGTKGKTREVTKRRRRSGPSNLKEKRVCLASQVKSTDFQRKSCCKRLRCFERLDQNILRECVKETLLMGPLERRDTLKSWLIDGVFMFDGKRVCSAFLARAFGFSRDLQRAVRTCNDAAKAVGDSSRREATEQQK